MFRRYMGIKTSKTKSIRNEEKMNNQSAVGFPSSTFDVYAFGILSLFRTAQDGIKWNMRVDIAKNSLLTRHKTIAQISDLKSKIFEILIGGI